MRKRARIGASLVACLAISVLGTLPANAATGTISCAGSSESIANGNTGGGNSVSITTNYSLNCGAVGNRAQTNINGQILWASMPALVSGKTYYSRTYYGAMYKSRHYHNGTSNDLWA